MSIKKKSELDTPCLILDKNILEENLDKVQEAAEAVGKNLRPHAKTHKCSKLAKKQIEKGAIGICVAKVSEAEVLAKTGIKNILVTGPVSTALKVERLVRILESDNTLMTVVDHKENIDLLDNVLAKKNLSMDVLLDIDIGLRRTGVSVDVAEDMADYILTKPNLRLRGLQAYGGHLQHIKSFEERKTSSLESLGKAVEVFNVLKKWIDGFDIMSGTGTGTFDIDKNIPEMTEFQVGSYTCMDVEYLNIGCAADEKYFKDFAPALRLLSSVVSANQKDIVTIDAGLKTLYRDGGIPEIISPKYGLKYEWFGDEYGRVILGEDGTGKLKLGDMVELVVAHCDPTINLFDKFYIVDGEDVIDKWAIDLRGCSQ